MSTVSVNLKPIKYGKSADLLALNTNKESYDVAVTSHEMLMDRDIFLNPCKLFSPLFDVFVELNSVIGRLIQNILPGPLFKVIKFTVLFTIYST